MLSRAGQPVKSFFLQNIKFFLFVYCFFKVSQVLDTLSLTCKRLPDMDELIRKKGAPFDNKRLTDGQFYLLLKGEIWCPQPNFLSPAFYNGKKHVGLK